MKKFGLLFALTGVLALGACGNGDADNGDNGESSDAEPRTIKLAHTGSETHQYHIAAELFK